MFASRKTWSLLLLVLLPGVAWIAAVVFGAGLLISYENESGDSGSAPIDWPGESQVPRHEGRPTLVMIAHPHCPCTRASIGELAAIMTRAVGKVEVAVLFIRPAGLPDGWEKTGIWRSAAAIPGVTSLVDEEGIEATRFGVSTSGHALLFNADGRLIFSGGITTARGHSGDNPGRQTILSLLNEKTTERDTTLVFGCSLREAPITAEVRQ